MVQCNGRTWTRRPSQLDIVGVLQEHGYDQFPATSPAGSVKNLQSTMLIRIQQSLATLKNPRQPFTYTVRHILDAAEMSGATKNN